MNQKIVRNPADKGIDDDKRYRFYIFIMRLIGDEIYKSYGRQRAH